jgi:hypothetical protein
VNKAPSLGKIFVESFINGAHRDTVHANTATSRQKSGRVPVNPLILLNHNLQ